MAHGPVSADGGSPDRPRRAAARLAAAAIAATVASDGEGPSDDGDGGEDNDGTGDNNGDNGDDDEGSDQTWHTPSRKSSSQKSRRQHGSGDDDLGAGEGYPTERPRRSRTPARAPSGFDPGAWTAAATNSVRLAAFLGKSTPIASEADTHRLHTILETLDAKNQAQVARVG